jgi:hypothetical protein
MPARQSFFSSSEGSGEIALTKISRTADRPKIRLIPGSIGSRYDHLRGTTSPDQPVANVQSGRESRMTGLGCG